MNLLQRKGKKMTYTISLIDIINQIWLDGHEDEKYDTLLMPKWDNYLTKLDEKIDYAIPKIFSLLIVIVLLYFLPFSH